MQDHGQRCGREQASGGDEHDLIRLLEAERDRGEEASQAKSGRQGADSQEGIEDSVA
jgi:hypothetical protein